MMKYNLAALFIAAIVSSSVIYAQDEFDDDSDFDVEDEYDVQDEEAEIIIPKAERLTFEPPQLTGDAHFADAILSVESFKKKWVLSETKKDGAEEEISKYDGEWSAEEPSDNPLINDLSLVLKSKAKHHAVSALLDKPFKFAGKPLIVQYEVKFQTGQECGGAYIKLLSHDSKLSLKNMQDKTPYTIMFGPDKCGSDDKLHFIFRHKNPRTGVFEEKHAKKPTGHATVTGAFGDKKTHLYRLIVNPDNTFEIFVDRQLVNSGSLLEDVSPAVNPPKEIEDVNDVKPADWDERERIADPDATKPDDWDEDAPEYLADETAIIPDGWLEDEEELMPDPDAQQPEDWDEEIDGDWEAPLISNPACEAAPGCGEWSLPQVKNDAYKGKWKAPKIDNPKYQGKWKPRMILNPNFFEDLNPYKMTPIGAIGLELWSMSNDIAFDNFLIVDDLEVADKWTSDTWEVKKSQELVSTSGKSVMDSILEMTNEKPWMLAVLLLVVVLPLILLIAYCCSSFSPKPPPQLAAAELAAAQRKKTDAVTPDDKVSAETAEASSDDDTDKMDGKDTGAAGDAQSSKSPRKSSPSKKSPSSKKASKSDLEADDVEPADGEEDDEQDEKPATRSSPRKRSARARKD